MAILDDVKAFCEVEATTIYDNRLLGYLNAGLSWLANLGIPVTIPVIGTETGFPGLQSPQDYILISYWCQLHCQQLFDKEIWRATAKWIDEEKVKVEYQLFAIYDLTGGD
jgi:hypothetical protein